MKSLISLFTILILCFNLNAQYNVYNYEHYDANSVYEPEGNELNPNQFRLSGTEASINIDANQVCITFGESLTVTESIDSMKVVKDNWGQEVVLFTKTGYYNLIYRFHELQKEHLLSGIWYVNCQTKKELFYVKLRE